MTKQNPSGFFSGNNSRDDSTMLKVAKKRSYVLHKRRCIPNWMILTAVLTLFAVAFSVTVAVYNLSTPLKCYQCSWAATTLKPTPNSSCHLNQHKVADATVKTCARYESYCGVSRTMLSFDLGNGTERHEYGLIRGCFSEYPLPTVVQDLNGTSTTYYGTNEGVDYGQVFSGRVKTNLTVVGRYCTGWNLCNAGVAHSSWYRSFFDSHLFFKIRTLFD